MNKKNNYNSIVFLTTLSVYLGLVLIGAPPIVAQAALTKSFDVKSEIEANEDEPKCPVPENEEIEKLEGLINLEDFFKALKENLQKLQSIGKYNIVVDSDFSIQKITFFGEEGHSLRTSGTGSWMTAALEESLWQVTSFREFAEFSPSAESEKIVEEDISVSFDEKEIALKISFNKSSPQKAKLFAENFNKAAIIKLCKKTKESFLKKAYENTRATTENNQVFIVTRLPRASIDEFFAEKVAQ